MRRREPDRLAAAGAAGRSAALAAFAAERLPWDATLVGTPVYCASGGTGESRLFVRKEGEWRFPALAPAEAQAYLNELVDGYLLDVAAAAAAAGAVAPAESLLRRRKGCHLNGRRDAAESAEQILQTYEGNMVVSGEGADIWYQRLWRSLEPAHYEEIIAQTQRYLLPLYRYHRSTQI